MKEFAKLASLLKGYNPQTVEKLYLQPTALNNIAITSRSTYN